MDNSNSIQLNSSQDFKITIDYLSDKAFDTELGAKESKNGEVVESRRKNITSAYKITNLTDAIISLTEFDRAVLHACIAEQAADNEYTTPERLYHWLGGGHVLTDDMRRAIMDSLERLACVRIEINMEVAQEKIGYAKGSPSGHFRGFLMPTESLEVIINGQVAKSAIHFLKKGIIFSIADTKNQIITCDKKLLEAPIRHSERGIALNHYVVRRTLEIKGSYEAHKKNKRVQPLRNAISFETMLEKCGMKDVTRDQRFKAKNIVTKILDHLVELGEIKSYSFKIADRGRICSITLEF